MPDDTIRARSILSDQPADEDRLNFTPYARTLTDILADPGTDTPLTIGVFGGWGQGKTSLMNMVRLALEATPDPSIEAAASRGTRPATPFPVRTVWFNAWAYTHQQSLWRALISRVLVGVRGFQRLSADQRTQLDRLEARLYPPSTTTAGLLTLQAGALAGLEALELPPLMALELLRRQSRREGKDAGRLDELIADVEQSETGSRRDQIAALDDFRREFEKISKDCIVDHGRLVVFVDDLDRCLPEQAVEVLEATKLFLDVPGCAFVLAIARDVIEQGIRVRYRDYEKQLDGAHYLEKIIQIPFSLPPIAPESVSGYIRGITTQGLPDPRCESVFAVGLEPNPRRIKRTLNIFLLLWRLAQHRDDLKDVIKPVRLAKIVIIQQYHPELFELIRQGPHYLIDLERRFRETERPERGAREGGALVGEPGGSGPSPGAAGGATTGGEGEISAGPLAEFLGNRLLRALLTCVGSGEADANFDDIGPAGVREYVYLTRSTVEEAPKAETMALPFEPQMITIPAGSSWMGASASELAELATLEKGEQYKERIKNEAPQHQIELAAYAIGRYPVTNAEFERFVEEGGYATQEHWTGAGWKQKESNGWSQPRLWNDEQWNDPSQPVVGVSWFEAVAYCRWLAAKTGKQYRLPTEAEWENAARGAPPTGESEPTSGSKKGKPAVESRRYPWGDDWDESKCNNRQNGPGRTTPVGQFSPQGDSPYGVGDLVGQVWEWCGSKGAPFPYRGDDGREDPKGKDPRIVRGGSWYDDPPAAYCRCGYRFRLDPGNRLSYGGFRCARTLSS